MTDELTQRKARAVNYAVKRDNDFQCASCGANDSILVVEEKTTGELTTRCEGCLDRRSFDIRPHQWDEAERLREKIRKQAA